MTFFVSFSTMILRVTGGVGDLEYDLEYDRDLEYEREYERRE